MRGCQNQQNKSMECVRSAHRTANLLRGLSAAHANRYLSSTRQRFSNQRCSGIGVWK